VPARNSRRFVQPFAAAAAVALGIGLSAQAPAPAPPQQPAPVFKAGISVVPLTVTVLDKNGVPVKDLKASDFTVIENKRTREIVNFFPQEFVPGPVPPDPTTINRVRDETIAPATRRTFLIVLAFGHIEHPTNALEGAIELVRHRLLPQDAVAVMGFHRATTFTTDHERIARILELYRKDHEGIVSDINHFRTMSRAPVVRVPTDPRAIHPLPPNISAPPGGAPIPDAILKRIDDIFAGAAAVGGRPRGDGFLRNTTDMLLGMNRVTPVVDKPGQRQETFEEIHRQLRASGDDLTDQVLISTRLKLYAGLEYLRYLDGEKHMLFLSGGKVSKELMDARPIAGGALGKAPADAPLIEGGGVARNADDAQVLAKRAADARVTIDLIATNGTAIKAEDSGEAAGRIVAELTGGYYTSLEMAVDAVGKIDRGSRFSYLLGYTPSDSTLDGRYRDVDVKVNRPDVTVRFRHGYFAAAEPSPLELEALVKKSRIDMALTFDQVAKDIPLQVAATLLPQMGIQATARVDITIDAAPLAMELRDGRRRGQVELQIYCGDGTQAVIGEAGLTIDLDATEQQYQQWLQAGIRRTVRVPLSGVLKYVKAVAYDYGSDRVGSAMLTVK